jgi:hypothetical protein
MTEESKVTFNLWAVLGFLFLTGIASFTYLHAEGRETKVKQQDVIQRVVIMETKMQAIMEGINELKTGQKEVIDSLKDHEKSSASMLRVKKWNEIK